jgi:hypothetical protein
MIPSDVRDLILEYRNGMEFASKIKKVNRQIHTISLRLHRQIDKMADEAWRGWIIRGNDRSLDGKKYAPGGTLWQSTFCRAFARVCKNNKSANSS